MGWGSEATTPLKSSFSLSPITLLLINLAQNVEKSLLRAKTNHMYIMFNHKGDDLGI